MSATKHLPALVFGLCLVAIIVNTSLWASAEIYVGGIVIGSIAVWWMQRGEKKDRPAEDREQEIARLRKELAQTEDMIASARAAKAGDRIAFLQPRLDETKKRLEKLGA